MRPDSSFFNKAGMRQRNQGCANLRSGRNLRRRSSDLRKMSLCLVLPLPVSCFLITEHRTFARSATERESSQANRNVLHVSERVRFPVLRSLAHLRVLLSFHDVTLWII
jgi:hypothetical protein